MLNIQGLDLVEKIYETKSKFSYIGLRSQCIVWILTKSLLYKFLSPEPSSKSAMLHWLVCAYTCSISSICLFWSTSNCFRSYFMFGYKFNGISCNRQQWSPQTRESYWWLQIYWHHRPIPLVSLISHLNILKRGLPKSNRNTIRRVVI